MKKTTVERVREEAKYFCDKHPDRECFSEIKSQVWYGSGFDLQHIKVNLCDECLEALYNYIKENFGVESYNDELSLFGRCPCQES